MFNISNTQIALLVLFYLHSTATISSIYIHRGRSHGALDFSQGTTIVFQCWLWLFGALSNRYKIASHLLHHKYSDTALDVNGPRALGITNIMLIKPLRKFISILTAPFRKPIFVSNGELEKIASKMSDPGVFYKYNIWGVWVNLLLQVIAFGLSGVVIWFFAVLVIHWLAISIGDGIIHLVGYQTFNTKDYSKNFMPIGILVGGEELHNNHHHSPRSAKLSVKWWEFDIGWLYIYILAKLKLVSIIKK